MRSRSGLLVCLLFCFGCTALGQGQRVVSEVVITITDQPDSPIRITLDRDGRPMPNSRLVAVKNVSERPVRAYVILSETDRGRHSKTGIRPSMPLVQGESVPEGAGSANAVWVTLSVDFVQFADGSTWGKDALGKSEHIAEYLTGRELAIERLKELLAGQDATDFLRTIGNLNSSGFGEPFPAPRSSTPERQRLRGYRGVINSLRAMPRRTEEAQELARKLELQEKNL